MLMPLSAMILMGLFFLVGIGLGPSGPRALCLFAY